MSKPEIAIFHTFIDPMSYPKVGDTFESAFSTLVGNNAKKVDSTDPNTHRYDLDGDRKPDVFLTDDPNRRTWQLRRESEGLRKDTLIASGVLAPDSGGALRRSVVHRFVHESDSDLEKTRTVEEDRAYGERPDGKLSRVEKVTERNGNTIQERWIATDGGEEPNAYEKAVNNTTRVVVRDGDYRLPEAGIQAHAKPFTWHERPETKPQN